MAVISFIRCPSVQSRQVVPQAGLPRAGLAHGALPQTALPTGRLRAGEPAGGATLPRTGPHGALRCSQATSFGVKV